MNADFMNCHRLQPAKHKEGKFMNSHRLQPVELKLNNKIGINQIFKNDL
jgi:hypothetical protein